MLDNKGRKYIKKLGLYNFNSYFKKEKSIKKELLELHTLSQLKIINATLKAEVDLGKYSGFFIAFLTIFVSPLILFTVPSAMEGNSNSKNIFIMMVILFGSLICFYALMLYKKMILLNILEVCIEEKSEIYKKK